MNKIERIESRQQEISDLVSTRLGAVEKNMVDLSGKVEGTRVYAAGLSDRLSSVTSTMGSLETKLVT